MNINTIRSKFTGIELLTAVISGRLEAKEAHTILATHRHPTAAHRTLHRPARAASFSPPARLCRLKSKILDLRFAIIPRRPSPIPEG